MTTKTGKLDRTYHVRLTVDQYVQLLAIADSFANYGQYTVALPSQLPTCLDLASKGLVIRTGSFAFGMTVRGHKAIQRIKDQINY